jgi:hypothetical protein
MLHLLDAASGLAVRGNEGQAALQRSIMENQFPCWFRYRVRNFEFSENYDVLIMSVKNAFSLRSTLLDCHDNECQMLPLSDENLMDESQIEIAQGLKARFVTQDLITRLVPEGLTVELLVEGLITRLAA